MKRLTLKSLEPDAESPAHDRASRFQGRADHLIGSAAWEFGLDFDYSKLFNVPSFILTRLTSTGFAHFVLTKRNISLAVLAHILHTLHQPGKQAAFQFPPHFSALRQRMRKTKKTSRQAGRLMVTQN
ncbi:MULTISPECIES: hypothetical protein [unclassified Pseudomonas]|uniref:hypothetical protein n=1 Tax=unclassified Pseudomonas TaxID=196821 RepID=UPI00249AAE8F|nr:MULTISPECIES: hypothetical protein [unclassified Pseudomonas]MDI3249778.1 hypothetical protein [Pseudomonas sp. AL10]MDI3267142.1 hypothetical protein [Pseudomonas sp. AL15]